MHFRTNVHGTPTSAKRQKTAGNFWNAPFRGVVPKTPIWGPQRILRTIPHESLRSPFTPLIYSHVNPYGIFELDMEQRLLIEVKAVAYSGRLKYSLRVYGVHKKLAILEASWSLGQ